MIITKETAIRAFLDARGDDMIDDADIAEAVREIGDPTANLPVTETLETADNYRAAGYSDEARAWADEYREQGLTVLSKVTGQRNTKRGYVDIIRTVMIADTGDKRLVSVQ
jgi:hypothetical protein